MRIAATIIGEGARAAPAPPPSRGGGAFASLLRNASASEAPSDGAAAVASHGASGPKSRSGDGALGPSTDAPSSDSSGFSRAKGRDGAGDDPQSSDATTPSQAPSVQSAASAPVPNNAIVGEGGSAALAMTSAETIQATARQGAFGFDQLGMFGLHAATAGPSIPRLSRGGPVLTTPTAAGTDAVLTSVSQDGGSTGDAAEMAGDDALAAGPDGAREGGAPNAGRGAAAPEVAGTPAGGAASLAAPSPSPVEDIEARAAAERPASPSVPAGRAVSTSPKSPINLTVADEGAALHVAGLAPAMDPQTELRLRQLAEATAAEFGKRIATLSVNGAAIEPDPTSHMGARR